MVKLEGRATTDEVILSSDSFEHLLNCLDNQKYIRDVNADALDADEIRATQNDAQAAIDDFSRQCRQLWLSGGGACLEEN